MDKEQEQYLRSGDALGYNRRVIIAATRQFNRVGALYDALFIPYRHFVPLPPKEEARFVFTVFASVAKQSPGRGK